MIFGVVVLFILGAIVFFALKSIVFVAPGHVMVMQRAGVYSRTLAAGTYFLPNPFETAKEVIWSDGQRRRRYTMLPTGKLYCRQGNLIITYRLVNARKAVFHDGDAMFDFLHWAKHREKGEHAGFEIIQVEADKEELAQQEISVNSELQQRQEVWSFYSANGFSQEQIFELEKIHLQKSKNF